MSRRIQSKHHTEKTFKTKHPLRGTEASAEMANESLDSHLAYGTGTYNDCTRLQEALPPKRLKFEA